MKSNDSYYSAVATRERDGCMTFFLVVLGALSILQVGALIVTIMTVGSAGLLGVIALGAASLQLFAIVALWNWKRSGYNMLMILYIISIALALLSGDFASVLVQGLVIGILYLLYRDKMDLLE